MIDKLAWIEIQDGKILCTRSEGKKTWYIPGGKREAGESDTAALMREIKEELDVDILSDTIQFMGEFSAQADGKSAGIVVKMTCYYGQYEGKLKASNEIAELRWLHAHEVGLTSQVDHKIFAALVEKGELR